MTDKELIQQISDLGYMHAPKSLHVRMREIVDDLPDVHRGFYFPLFAFQMAIVGVVMVVLLALGSGVVVAAKSEPGTPLFPVREMLYKIIPHIVENAFPTPTPILPTPTSVQSVLPTVTPSQEKHHVQVVGKGDDEKGEREEEHVGSFLQNALQKVQDVKGVHDERRHTEDHKEHEKDQ